MTRLCFRNTAGASDANSRHEIIRCTTDQWLWLTQAAGHFRQRITDEILMNPPKVTTQQREAAQWCAGWCYITGEWRVELATPSHVLGVWSFVRHTCCLLVTFTASTMFASRWDSWASATSIIFLLTSAGSILSSRNSFVVRKESFILLNFFYCFVYLPGKKSKETP